MADAARVTAFVADDEPIARAGLRRLLADVSWIETVGEAASGPAALEAIDRLRPELVFLDVEMPGFSGIELLSRLRHRPWLVFTTAYAEHAVTAFELGALDYLLKPFGAERVQTALERLRAQLGEPVPSAIERFGEFAAGAPLTRLFVRSGRSIVPLAADKIVRVEAVGDFVAVHTAEGSHLLHLALGRLEQRLDARRFVRIHRTHLVNLDQVTAFRRQEGGAMVAVMHDGTTLPVSRQRAQELRALAR